MKKLFFATFLVLMLFVSYVPQVYAAGGTFFGPIVPNGTNGQPDCNCLSVISPNTGESVPSAPDWGCIMQTVQNTVNFAITLGMIIAILYIVYSGFLFVMSAGNPSSREAAKTRITNVVIGLVVMLGAWLVIDFVMKRLYGESGLYGPWNAILTEDGKPHCLQVAKPPTPLAGVEGQAPLGPSTTGGTGTGDNCTPIPDSQLKSFPSEATSSGPERALADTVDRFMSMRAEALKNGVDLKVADGYRSPEEQLSAWNNNGCQIVNGNTVCKKYTAAVPCSLGGNGSNHTGGTAVDIHLGTGVYTWLRANAAKHGFYNNIPNDLPHWSSTGR